MRSIEKNKIKLSHPAFFIFRFNIIIVILWGITLLLQKNGLPFLVPILGVLVLVTPGICITLLLEQLSESKIKPIALFLWALLISFTLTPAAVYVISVKLLKQAPVLDVMTPFLIWWGIALAVTIIVCIFKHQPTAVSNLSPDRSTKRELIYIIGAYVAIMLINFIVYPLLPEGDGYAYLIRWKEIQANPQLLFTETRPLFSVLLSLFSRILQVDPYWILKAFLPLSGIAIILSCYIFCRNFITDTRYRILLSLSPIFFPIVLQEILISRPQSIVLISFIPSLVLISEVLNDKKNLRKVYWLLALFVIGLIGIKIHTLFIFIAIAGLLSIIVFLWRDIVSRPMDSVVILIGLLLLLSPQLSNTRILSDSWQVLKLFAASFSSGQFDFWFIDHYRNVDGIELGWPGYLSFFYYGYNLGLLFPIVLLVILTQRRIGSFKNLMQTKYWAIVFLLLFFFFIAEIAPRFKIAYLPDRAWLFVSLLLALVLPIMVSGLKNSQRYLLFIATLSFLTVAAGTMLTYLKQGWVTTEEVAMAPFIKGNTPENAIILAQGGTRMMVRYYTGRVSIRPDNEAIYLTGEKSALEGYLRDEEAAYQESLMMLTNRKNAINETLTGHYQQKNKIDLSDQDRKKLLESLLIIQEQESNSEENTERLKELYPTVGRSVYIIYNENKFSSLYGSRGWWRSSNFYGANLKELNENYPVVYAKNGITIWEARK